MKLCPRCDAPRAIGSDNARPRAESGDDPLARGLSIESAKGGFGLYYRSPLVELGAVAHAGTPIGAEQRPTPVEVLLKSDRALDLAHRFHEAIEGTDYYERYERTEAPIPRAVLEELADRVCLCRLDEFTAERDAIRRLLFEPPSDEAAAACDARRRAFALYLSLVDERSAVADRDGEFWRAVIERFSAGDPVGGAAAETVAAWSALAMKECVEEAVCSVWTDFCRSGMREQGLDGLSNPELVEMIRGLADDDALELDGTRLVLEPDEPARGLQERAVGATRGMDWEDLRAWVVEADIAAAGLVALLIYAERLPDPPSAGPIWTEIAWRRSEHQDGLLGIVSTLRRRLASGPTTAELLDWIVRRFVIGPHEALA